ncbi:MAG: Preprotein translocase, SecE subunit [Candidatus Woesebacteria bacterium GW2011_GWB1_43_14]|uniref:Protein translocase subunit SecE n=1 Tax=Candidatus Woesebacteria bacterium GW2011_GWB1_43_14 TaxID=1618578 RepID=A0A0G1GDF8_9BACT|nr:MAG: Preprotein translocase, SecE subunit [Candidatus Woesebacteria bacterium GW2011_GWC1_42_9]KKS96918.1 MAG: Preprotein translocase, SecE subunit [Candidatus Woesebacteria bacterium GW2011_GWB1_43_14]
MGGLFQYFREVRSELGKVIWPKREEVVKLTATVLLISAIVGLYLTALDLGFTKLIETIISG